jgi:homoaconitase/3-isopropylmalate dehydratase large subunit
MEGRMTLCNLSIEGGARMDLVAPLRHLIDGAENNWVRKILS